MSLILVPGREEGACRDRRRPAVVGLGPGRAGLADTGGAAALARADVLVGYEPYLARVPRGAGSSGAAATTAPSWSGHAQALELALAARGSRSSPPATRLFAMARAVSRRSRTPASARAVRARRPGLSAMQAAAARVGAPLGHDFCVISLSDQLKPWAVIERRLAAAGRRRPGAGALQPGLAHAPRAARARTRVLLDRAGETPVVLARAVGSADESLTITTLAGFDLGAVDMRTLVLVGSSQTRVLRGGERRSARVHAAQLPGVRTGFKVAGRSGVDHDAT